MMEFAKKHGPLIALGAGGTLIVMAAVGGKGQVAKIIGALVASTAVALAASKIA